MTLQLRRRRLLTASAAASAGAFVSLPTRAAGEDIVVGQSVHLTGPLAPTFVSVKQGQDLAVAQLNKRGGINGRKLRLLTLDDGFDPKKCVENVHRLIDQEKAIALFGLAATATVGATLPVLAEKKVPLVGVYTGSPALRAKHHPYFFTTMASYQDEVVQMLRNLVTLQRTQVALLYQNSAFGQLMKPVVEAAAREIGASIVATAPMEPNGSDAVQAAQTLAAAKPQAVLFMAFGPSMVPFVKAAKAYIGAPLYCISISNASPILQALGDDARGLAFTQLIPSPWRATSSLVRDYHAAMEAAKLPIDYDHYFGYLNVRILAEGLKRAGKNPTSASVVAAMEGMRKTDIGGYTLDYSPNNHHGSKLVEISIYGPGGRWLL